ncbi:hypothetical protein N8975_05925 [Candidatus Pelagibacter ubique]|nr:hypothetical protein [Candidatus Pelagibacter ubique]
MSKFHYCVFEGEDDLISQVFSWKETARIKKIKLTGSVNNFSNIITALNIIGDLGYELITVPQLGRGLLIFKKKL